MLTVNDDFVEKSGKAYLQFFNFLNRFNLFQSKIFLICFQMNKNGFNISSNKMFLLKNVDEKEIVDFFMHQSF